MEIRCKKCGRFFIADKYPNRRYCSPECNPWISTKRPSKSCKICGKDLHRKGNAGPFPTYCTEACRWEAHYKRYPKKYTKPCAYCGKPNHQKRGIVNKYCSEDCRSNDAIRNQEQQCEICGKLFTKDYFAKCCSSDCQAIATNKTIRESGKREASFKKVCVHCGNIFFVDYFHQWAEACSIPCSDAWYAKRNPDKVAAQRAKRRMRKAAAFIENVNPFDIFERDHWTCKLCGRKINKELKYPHPMSVSLDHIMPLAKGGTHEWDNLQASHLRCNMSKGARVADV